MAMYWRRFKAIAAVINRRQWQRDFDPHETLATEIQMEHLSGNFLVIESSVLGTPTYIIAE